LTHAFLVLVTVGLGHGVYRKLYTVIGGQRVEKFENHCLTQIRNMEHFFSSCFTPLILVAHATKPTSGRFQECAVVFGFAGHRLPCTDLFRFFSVENVTNVFTSLNAPVFVNLPEQLVEA